MLLIRNKIEALIIVVAVVIVVNVDVVVEEVFAILVVGVRRVPARVVSATFGRFWGVRGWGGGGGG